MKSIFIPTFMAAVLAVSVTVEANKIESVIAVDYLNVEVMMKEPLTEKELDPRQVEDPDYKPSFTFNEGVRATGSPVLQPSDGFHENVYRIPVNGLDIGIIYRISYKGQKPYTFKAYESGEMKDKYRERYGSYF